MTGNIANICVSIFWYLYTFLAPDVSYDDIYNMICEILQKYFPQEHNNNYQHISYHYFVSTSAEKYFICATKIANIKF